VGPSRDDPPRKLASVRQEATSFPKGELKAQSIGDFLDPPLIPDQIAGRRYDGRLPAVSVIPADLDAQLSRQAQKRSCRTIVPRF
jgi:hypothetical protein